MGPKGFLCVAVFSSSDDHNNEICNKKRITIIFHEAAQTYILYEILLIGTSILCFMLKQCFVSQGGFVLVTVDLSHVISFIRSLLCEHIS